MATPPAPRTPNPQVATLPPSDSPKDAYDLAYGYILRRDYALAEDGFRTFLSKYPNDRQAPEAQYWLGESLFQRQLYREAAENFLNVSTRYETTPKAPDALLRLGQALKFAGYRSKIALGKGLISVRWQVGLPAGELWITSTGRGKRAGRSVPVIAAVVVRNPALC